MELIFETVTRGNKVLSCQKVTGNRITIGRGYDNDVILQEEHVCPNHAELIVEDGQMLLVDKGSINGIKDQHNNAHAAKIQVKSGDVFVFGKVFLRILSAQHPVVATKKINFIEDFTRACNHWYWALAMIILYYIILLTNSYYETYQEIVWSKLLVTAVFSSLAMFVLPLFVALMARVFKKDVKFFTIVFFCYAISVIWLLLTNFGQVLTFNWGDSKLISLGAELLDYSLLLLFLAGSFYLASNMTLRRIATVSSALVLSFAMLFYINEMGDDNVKLSPNMHGTVLPSKWLWAQPQSAEVVKQHSQRLFSQASDEANRRNLEAEQD